MVLWASCSVLGRTSERVRSGRPGQSIDTLSVGKEFIQFQSGIQWDGESSSLKNATNTYSISSLFRFGLTESTELNVEGSYRFDANAANPNGFDKTSLGMRFDVLSGEGNEPSLGVQATYHLNLAEGSLGNRSSGAELLLATNIPINKKVSATLNLGPKWDGINLNPAIHYVAGVSLTLTPAWFVFVENYGNFQNGVFATFFDTGFGWITSDDDQWDFSFGIGRNNSVSTYFMSTGYTFRFSQTNAN